MTDADSKGLYILQRRAVIPAPSRVDWQRFFDTHPQNATVADSEFSGHRVLTVFTGTDASAGTAPQPLVFRTFIDGKTVEDTASWADACKAHTRAVASVRNP